MKCLIYPLQHSDVIALDYDIDRWKVNDKLTSKSLFYNLDFNFPEQSIFLVSTLLWDFVIPYKPIEYYI